MNPKHRDENITIISSQNRNVLQHAHYRDSGAEYTPPTRQRLRDVNWIFVIGVRFVGNVARRSDLDKSAVSVLIRPPRRQHKTHVSTLSSSP